MGKAMLAPRALGGVIARPAQRAVAIQDLGLGQATGLLRRCALRNDASAPTQLHPRHLGRYAPNVTYAIRVSNLAESCSTFHFSPFTFYLPKGHLSCA